MSNDYTEGFFAGAISVAITIAAIMLLSNWMRGADGPPHSPPYHKIEI